MEEKKMTFAEALELLKEAWVKGVEMGIDHNTARIAQRTVIAKRVKDARTEKGISQEAISELVNVNSLTYKGYEGCKSDIPVFILVRLANALEVSLDFLTGRTDQEKQQLPGLEERVSRLEKLLEQSGK